MATLNIGMKIGGAIDAQVTIFVGANAAYAHTVYTVPANSYLQVQAFSLPQNLRLSGPNGNFDLGTAYPEAWRAKQLANSNASYMSAPFLVPAGFSIISYGTNGIIAGNFTSRVVGILISNTQ